MSTITIHTTMQPQRDLDVTLAEAKALRDQGLLTPDSAETVAAALVPPPVVKTTDKAPTKPAAPAAKED